MLNGKTLSVNWGRATGRERKTWAIGRYLLVALLPLVVGAGPAPRRVEKTFETDATPHVSLNNLAGKITVRGWAKPQVHVVCTLASAGVEIDAQAFPADSRTAEKVHLDTHVLDTQLTGRDQEADYTVDVPLASCLEISDRQGSVEIENIQGDVFVETVGGTITVKDAWSHLSVRSVGGDIELVRPSGRVEASSITGNFHFLLPAGSQLRGNTTSGRILYEGDFVPGGDYVMSSYSGDIDVVCPSSASFELNAKTVKGKLQNALVLSPTRHSPYPSSAGNSLLGTHNTGRANVELKSFSGTIRIRPQP